MEIHLKVASSLNIFEFQTLKLFFRIVAHANFLDRVSFGEIVRRTMHDQSKQFGPVIY